MKFLFPLIPRVLLAARFIQEVAGVVSNDVCQTAVPIAVGTAFVVNTSSATRDNVTNDCRAGIDLDYPGVWYTFLGTPGERLLARACENDNGDSFLSVFTGNCSRLQCVAPNTYGLCGAARFIFDTIANTTYHALVRNYNRDLANVTLTRAPPAPVNEFCESASPIAIGETVYANLTYATTDALSDYCFNEDFLYVEGDFPGVWYSFVGTGERLVARFCNAERATTITILEGGGCNVTNMKCVAGFQRSCNQWERASFDTVSGTTYYVLLRSIPYNTEDVSLVEFSLSVGAPLNNDICEDAQPISIGSTVRANCSYATAEADDDLAVCASKEYPLSHQLYPDVWYTFVGNGKRVTGRLLGPSCDDSSMEPIALTIFSGSCNATNLTCVAGTIDLCARGRLLFPTVQGTTYYALVSARNPDSIVDLKIATCGPFQLGIFCPPTRV